MEESKDAVDVKAVVVTCSKCGGAVSIGIKEGISKESSREIGKMVADGCDIYTTNVVVARTVRWCNAGIKDLEALESLVNKEPCEGMWPKKKKVKK